MTKTLLALTVAALIAVPAFAADVGVSVTIGQPGFYGHIDIGQLPRPQLIFPQPVIIVRPRVVVAPPPIYLRVPPGHERNWRKHCHRYDACGRPVYFVRDDWYRNVYVPHHRRHYRDDRDDHRRGDHRDRDAHPGRGHGHGKGRRDD